MNNKAKSSAIPKKLGVGAVYITAVTSILGAILFLRMGTATGTLGFFGIILLILLGHLITIPTALAISELATNTRVEGGGVYFIISRSFGLKIGATIGITLFLSEAISIAFYTIAFAEAFHPILMWINDVIGFQLPKQVISIPILLIMAWIVLKNGSGSSLRILYLITSMMFLAILCFFIGKPVTTEGLVITGAIGDAFHTFNLQDFFVMFAICFPAFTGLTMGVGLSGDLKNPGKSIPIGTIAATITGLVVYILVAVKFAASASSADLIANPLLMSNIAFLGFIIIPVGLAASTSSSGFAAFMVAPRTLQAIASDRIFPFRRLNIFFAKGKGANKEPVNASIFAFLIAFVFVAFGKVDTVANIITMFFLISYGSLCLISFLNHFGSAPSYRPIFKSRWYISLLGFVISIWTMFKINALYTVIAYAIIVLLYLFIEHANKEKKGLVNIFKGALFQANRRLQVYVQKQQSNIEKEEWRPAALCLSSHALEREKILDMMGWVGYQHGFGTFFHYTEGFYTTETQLLSDTIIKQLIEKNRKNRNTLYIDSITAPSFPSAMSQMVQTPSISGMDNNMVLLEYDVGVHEELLQILRNYEMIKAGGFDCCIYATTARQIDNRNGIHVWINEQDTNNNLMIMLSYVLMAHPFWRKSPIKIFMPGKSDESSQSVQNLKDRIASDRLPVTFTNIEMVDIADHQSLHQVIEQHSKDAGLTMIGFSEANVSDIDYFNNFEEMGDILFVHATKERNIR
ncbi:MAG: amino acid permease [Bacteroidales bacterium]|nr:amino acid permease [Bacteroidales bacterium]